MASVTHLLRLNLTEVRLQSSPLVQTKHGAHVGVTQGHPEKNARSRGCTGAVAVRAPEQMACRKPIE